MTDDRENTPVIVEATASATASRKKRGRAIERAMADAVLQVSAESEEIWAREDLDLSQKNTMITELNRPDNVRSRMLAARDRAKGVGSATTEEG